MSIVNRSESINEIAKALADFQANVKQPEKTGTNPHLKSKYAKLEKIAEAIHVESPKHGLSYTQIPVVEPGKAGVATMLLHSSGQYMEFPPLLLPTGKETAQSIGSAITYSKRYSLTAAFGVTNEDDDDGHAATEEQKSYQKERAEAPPKVDRGQLLGSINNLIMDLADLNGADVKDVHAKFLEYFKTQTFETLDDTMLQTVYATVKANITKIRRQQGAAPKEATS